MVCLDGGDACQQRQVLLVCDCIDGAVERRDSHVFKQKGPCSAAPQLIDILLNLRSMRTLYDRSASAIRECSHAHTGLPQASHYHQLILRLSSGSRDCAIDMHAGIIDQPDAISGARYRHVHW